MANGKVRMSTIHKSMMSDTLSHDANDDMASGRMTNDATFKPMSTMAPSTMNKSTMSKSTMKKNWR